MMEWIKVSTTMFDDEKIRLIRDEKNGDELVCIWIQMLCLAGRQDNNGVFLLNESKAYTVDQIATILGRDKKRFRNAVALFETLGMVTVLNGCITLPNWEKYNKDNALRENFRNANRERQRRYRENQRNVTRNVTECNAKRYVTPEEKEEEIEKEYINNDDDSYKDICGVTQRILNVWPNLPQTAIEEIGSFIGELPEDVIGWALDETQMKPGAGYKYLRAILQSCVEKGLTTLDAVKQAEADRRAAKERGTAAKNAPNEVLNYQQHQYTEADFNDAFYTNLSDYGGKP